MTSDPRSDSLPSVEPRAVPLAAAAAGLLVAQQVASKALRDALFLEHFDVTRLPVASASAALLSLIVLPGFGRMLARRSPARLVPRALAGSAALLLLIAGVGQVAPRIATVALYLHHGAFGAALISGFWSLLNERFDPWTAKRSVGHIGMGASAGGVLAGLGAWWGSGLASGWTLLAVVAGVGVLALGPVLRIASATPAGEPPGSAGPAESGIGLVRRDGYLRELALLVGLLALVEVLLDYRLNAAVADSFERGPSMISFFALYHGALGLAAVVAQAALVRGSLEGLGLAGTLALLPAGVAAGSAAAALVPRLLGSVLLRGGAGALRGSLFRAAYELLFNPLPPERKRAAKALIDVGADRVGAALGSGVVLSLLALVPAAVFDSGLLALAGATSVVMIGLARRFHGRYVTALADNLRAGVIQVDSGEIRDATTRLTVTRFESRRAETRLEELSGEIADLASKDPVRVRRTLHDRSELDPRLVPWVVRLLGDDALMPAALEALRRSGREHVGQLADALLDRRQSLAVRRRIPRVLKGVPVRRAVEGLLLGLEDESLGVRARCAQALGRMGRSHPELRVGRERVLEAVESELNRPPAGGRELEVVFELLTIVVEREPLAAVRRALRGGSPALAGTALEYLETVLPRSACRLLIPRLGVGPAPSTPRPEAELREELLRSTRQGR